MPDRLPSIPLQAPADGSGKGPAPRVAVVTGASRGIGAAVARALAARGWSLLLVARTVADLETVATACRTGGAPRVVVLPADLATNAGLDAVVLTAVREFDGFDLLVNNAGVGRTRAAIDLADEEVDAHLAINLRAPILLTQAALKVMRRRGGGQVVQVTSGLAYHGRPEWSLYASAKWGLRGFTESVRPEAALMNVKVGMVAPGYTRTSFFDGWGPPAAFREPLEPDDVAHAVLALVEQPEGSDIKEITVRNRGSP